MCQGFRRFGVSYANGREWSKKFRYFTLYYTSPGVSVSSGFS